MTNIMKEKDETKENSTVFLSFSFMFISDAINKLCSIIYIDRKRFNRCIDRTITILKLRVVS